MSRQSERLVSQKSTESVEVLPSNFASSNGWINCILLLLLGLWMSVAKGWVIVPMAPLLIGTVLLLGFDAWRSFPNVNSGTTKRLSWLLVLALPWLSALLLGPLGMVAANGDPMRLGWMTFLQNTALVLSLVLPLVLTTFMRNARRFTLAIGVMNFIPALVVTSASLLIIAPGS